MEYERIEKVQAGMISPSKLRMKLMGPHNLRKKKEGGFNSNSSTTSPSKLGDSDFTMNRLLALENPEFKENATGMETAPATRKSEILIGSRSEIDIVPKGDGGNQCMSYSARVMEDENLHYDSNASSSCFEFHKGEGSSVHGLTRSGSRHVSSKWNDAEKWIRSKQLNANANCWKNTVLQNHTNHASSVTIIPGHSRFDFVPTAGMQCRDSICTKSMNDEPAGFTMIREVSMRDTGTEMTPATSQEPSRTATPVGSATPLWSPTSSIPSTPRRDAPAPTPADLTTDEELRFPREFSKRETTEEELKLKTRREIIALGAQLGKSNIAAWASREETVKNLSIVDAAAKMEEVERLEFERRAAAWEQAMKTKHATRYKREEIRIQAWEGQQKAKLEAETRRIEAQVDRMRSRAQARVSRKMEMARQRAEEKRAAVESRKKRDVERAAARAKYIRSSGRITSSTYICCGLLTVLSSMNKIIST